MHILFTDTVSLEPSRKYETSRPCLRFNSSVHWSKNRAFSIVIGQIGRNFPSSRTFGIVRASSSVTSGRLYLLSDTSGCILVGTTVAAKYVAAGYAERQKKSDTSS